MTLQKYEGIRKKDIFLKIAGFTIHLKSRGDFFLETGEAYQLFMVDKQEERDLNINITMGLPVIHHRAKIIFSSGNPELLDLKFNHNWFANVKWDIIEYQNKMFVRTYSNGSVGIIDKILELDFNLLEWTIYFNEQFHTCGREISLDPLSYPLGPLLLYYLVTLKGGIMLHSSGVFFSNTGYIFTGFSGRGKSTMARLWQEAGAKVINDDRLILTLRDGKVIMHNSPMYYPDKPTRATVDHVFAIHHARENTIKPYDYINGMAKIMAFSIQHNYADLLINKFLDNISAIAEAVSVNELGFLPDNKIVELLKEKYVKNN